MSNLIERVTKEITDAYYCLHWQATKTLCEGCIKQNRKSCFELDDDEIYDEEYNVCAEVAIKTVLQDQLRWCLELPRIEAEDETKRKAIGGFIKAFATKNGIEL